MMAAPVRVMAVDDEPLALRRLEIALSRMDGIDLVGTARSGREALDMIKTARPDILLLDILMAGMDGFDVVEALGGAGPQIIFVTAFDAFASRAFDVSAVDYVLKPVSFDRLRRAIDKACMRMEAVDAQEREKELRSLVATLREHQPLPTVPPRYETELWVQYRGEFVRLFVHDIEWISAERDYVELHVRGKDYLLRETMAGMLDRLDPEKFVRIHRSTIVRTDRITGIRSVGYGHYRVSLLSGATPRVGRTYVKIIRSLLKGRTSAERPMLASAQPQR